MTVMPSSAAIDISRARSWATGVPLMSLRNLFRRPCFCLIFSAWKSSSSTAMDRPPSCCPVQQSGQGVAHLGIPMRRRSGQVEAEAARLAAWVAVLIPAATRHRVRMLGVSTRSLYIEPDAVPWWPATCTVVDVPPLLRELLAAAVDFETDYNLSGREGTIITLLLHEIAARAPLPFHVQIPASADLAKLCRAYLADPDTGVTNAVYAAQVAMSERAFTRRFRSEAGDSPAVWRGRARLLTAVPLLRTAPVSEVSGRLRYASPPAFTAAFTRAFGTPPSRFAASRGSSGPGQATDHPYPRTRQTESTWVRQ
jgi:AraC-like DNA-binding protein